jgi:hypothetical protein
MICRSAPEQRIGIDTPLNRTPIDNDYIFFRVKSLLAPAAMLRVSSWLTRR